MPDLSQFLSSLGREILTAENFYALLPGIVERVAQRFDAAFAACYVSQDGRRDEIRWDRSLTPAARRFTAIPWLSDAVSGAPETRAIDPGAEGGQQLEEAGLSSALLASVGLEGADAIHLVVARSGGAYETDLRSQLEAVATTLALGASRSRLQAAAIFDACTGLYNRRYLDSTLPSELEKAQRFRMALTVMILDVDWFKEVNDKHGHLTGDRVLADVGRVLRESVRSCDIVVRYGGDEFVLVLPATNLNGASRVGDRIQRRVRELRVGTGRNKTQLTVSAGVAAASARSSAERLLALADERLYEAKRLGRNRIVFPEGKVPELSPQLNLLAPQGSTRSYPLPR